MAGKKKRRISPAHLPDEELIERVKKIAPEVLETRVPVEAFDRVVHNLATQPPSDERPHFYCRPCGEYHEKTHPHYRAQKQRAAKRRRA